MKVIIFCGYHKSGKTTLMTRAVRGIAKRGHSVATVKHSPGLGRAHAGHNHAEHDHVAHSDAGRGNAPTQTDSEKLFQAGSESTVLVTGEQILFTKRMALPALQDESMLHGILKQVHADYVLVEGFKSYRGPIPKLLFVHRAEDIAELRDRSVVAYTGHCSQEGWSDSIPFLPPASGEDTLADFVEKHAYHVND